jgi:hypothetical protein
MANKPTPGSSFGTWGAELNAYLDTEHDSDGTHGAITPTSISTAGALTVTGATTANGNFTANKFFGFGSAGELTIASGSITPTTSYHSVDTESDAATDNLDTIATTNATNGDILILCAENVARTVVVRDNATGSGNIYLDAATSFSMDHARDRLVLQLHGTVWVEISRSNNGA